MFPRSVVYRHAADMDAVDDLMSCLAPLAQADDVHAIAVLAKRFGLALYAELGG